MTIDLTQFPDTVEAFGGNEQRATVFLDRYSMKDSAGRPLERRPEETWGRVAITMARSDEDGFPATDQYVRFFNLLKDWKFVPGGRILAGAGTGSEVTFYNCYVIPVETKRRRLGRGLTESAYRLLDGADPGNDSREAIFDTIGLMVDIMSRGGGVGINWSVLRPKGAYLKRVNGTSSGPIGWMDVASKAVGEVEQGGSRRGAAMFMLDDWHPDVLDFIDAKRDFTRITNANVSVAVSDAFMTAVDADLDWPLVFPDTSDPAYDTEWDGDLDRWQDNGHLVTSYAVVRARDLWRKLAEAAHASGEPGVVFLGRYNEQSTGAGVERLISVNPCGEQGLGAYSVCNLGAMNLDAYIVHPGNPGRRAVEFDWVNFGADVRTAIEFLDRAIDVNFYFLPENERIQKRLRRVGLSVMGLADALIRLGIRYGSPEAVEFTETVFATMKFNAIDASASLAAELGAAPGWTSEMEDRPYIDSLKEVAPHIFFDVAEHGLRNLFLLTQAPTGTTSILAGVNSGIEPYFALQYTRKDRTGEHVVVAPVLDKIGYDNSYTADYLVTSKDVTVEEHIAMQAAVQKYVDSSVSKTINAPNDQTVEEVEKAFTLAYNSGLKGLAYFRDGSGRAQVLYAEAPKQESAGTYKDDFVERLIEENEDLMKQVSDLENELAEVDDGDFVRPTTLSGRTTKTRTTAGTAYVTVNRSDEGKPVEVFISIGKSGQNIMEMGEAMGRLASLALRKGATLGGVANQLEGIGGTSPFFKSLPAAVSAVLTEENRRDLPPIDYEGVMSAASPYGAPVQSSSYHYGPIPTNTLAPKPITAVSFCPECSSQSVAREEGCQKCHSCGWSAC